jgi:1,2-phenylacetyl-CoA epoxidase catalytic subunit
MKEEQDKKDEPIKPKSNSKLRQVWQKRVAPPLEAPLLEAPPQKSSSSRANRGTRSMKLRKEQSHSKDLKHQTLAER